jgi:hypothetical protein
MAFVKVVGVVRSTTFLFTTLCTSIQLFGEKCSQRRVDRLKISAAALQSVVGAGHPAGGVCAARRAPAVAPASACVRLVPHRLEVRAVVPFAPAVLGTRAVFTASYRAVLPGGPSSASLLGAAA